MMFEFTRRSGACAHTGASTFRVENLSRHTRADALVDISHLIDRTYDYRSDRELRWHLAERFGIAPDNVSLREGQRAA